MVINYEPNTIHWKLGDLVIHDYDLKRPSMLMRVIGFTKEGEVVTKYENPQPPSVSLRGRKKAWVNDRKYLHDPALFKIMETPKEKPMTTNTFIEGEIYRSINERTGKPEPYDSDAPDYDCYQPTATGGFWLCDCWVVDSEGRQHPGYSESAVPVRKGCLGEIVKN